MWPSELSVPSKSAEPVIPSAGSTKADCARSSFLMVIFAWAGVRVVSVGLIGPAVPSMLSEPPPGSSAEATTGNLLVKEKSLIETLTLS